MKKFICIICFFICFCGLLHSEESDLEIFLESKMLECAEEIEELDPNLGSSSYSYYYLMGKWHAYLDTWDHLIE